MPNIKVWALRFRKRCLNKLLTDTPTDNGQTGITKAHIGTLPGELKTDFNAFMENGTFAADEKMLHYP